MTSMSPMASMSPDERAQYYDEPAGSGWLFFAGTVLGLAGLMRIVDSIWAFRYNGALPAGLKDGVLGDNLTTYGWNNCAIKFTVGYDSLRSQEQMRSSLQKQFRQMFKVRSKCENPG